MHNLNIESKYLTRVEGHGNIIVKIKNDKVVDCRFEVIESPRFFEQMLLGRSVFEAQHLTSRICGICACGHSLASIKAAEAAMGIRVSRQTALLRKLLLYSEIMDSHLLHFYILVAPDLLGAGSIFPLVKTRPQVVRRALRMKRVSDYMGEALAGRHIHPISFVVGGLTKLPTLRILGRLRAMLISARRDYDATISLFRAIKFPHFLRRAQYVCLSKNGEYAYLDGKISLNRSQDKVNSQDYLSLITEFPRKYSTAKFSAIRGRPYAVGALARFNNNYPWLHTRAKQAAKALKLTPPCFNPYLNTLAQIVEWRHCLEKSLEIIELLLDKGIKKKDSLVSSWPSQDKRPIKVKAGRGVGAVEVPRGTLYHDYAIDKNGLITRANCIIPTAQNLFNLEEDMKGLIPRLIAAKQSRRQIQAALEMLARAYDPCISCATHIMDVRFVR
ncbi:MAG: Ni/Fe hydrogenase subunit alpha [Candidatus Omnitrophota bacterium]